MKTRRWIFIFTMGAFCVMLSSCEGIFEGIYDKMDVSALNDYGFIERDEATRMGTIYVDAHKYDQWVLVNFHTQTIDSVRIDALEGYSKEWDLALHRNNVRTNNGMVYETGTSGLVERLLQNHLREAQWVTDVWEEKVVVSDISRMLEGKIGYTPSFINPELSKWLTLDMTTRPPSYNQSNKAYLLKLKDGTVAAVFLKNYRHSVTGSTGFLTINYLYPLREQSNE